MIDPTADKLELGLFSGSKTRRYWQAPTVRVTTSPTPGSWAGKSFLDFLKYLFKEGNALEYVNMDIFPHGVALVLEGWSLVFRVLGNQIHLSCGIKPSPRRFTPMSGCFSTWRESATSVFIWFNVAYRPILNDVRSSFSWRIWLLTHFVTPRLPRVCRWYIPKSTGAGFLDVFDAVTTDNIRRYFNHCWRYMDVGILVSTSVTTKNK